MDRLIVLAIRAILDIGNSETKKGSKLRLLGLLAGAAILCLGLYLVLPQIGVPGGKPFAVVLFGILVVFLSLFVEMAKEKDAGEGPEDGPALGKLEEMKAAGLITEEEYREKREETLNRL